MILEEELEKVRKADDSWHDHEWYGSLKLDDFFKELQEASDLDAVKVVMFKFMVEARQSIYDLEQKCEELDRRCDGPNPEDF